MDDWKFLDARQCEIGGVSCLAIRISYTGELGWELYPAMEDMASVYREILNRGGDLGLGHVGTRVINTLRIEKGEDNKMMKYQVCMFLNPISGFRAWGREMNKDVSPIESGLMPFVRMKKQVDFIGKAALAERLKIPMTTSTVMLQVDTDNCDPEGDESVMMLGKAVGLR